MESGFVFETIHIDVARNATDDFNLFHDKLKWSEIKDNPFGGPIVLGFQLLGFIADNFFDYRQANKENSLILENKLDFSYYQLKFANIVKPKQTIALEIKNTQINTSPTPQLSNRYLLKADNRLVVAGFKKELSAPNILLENEIPDFEHIHNYSDRSFIRDENFFVKHKYLNTSNGKNLLVACLVEQSRHFDEINDKVVFPEVFPLALISCALLERAHKLGHDFKAHPMVYVSHQHCIDKKLTASLSSNTKLSIIVNQEKEETSDMECARCWGIINKDQILFRSELYLSPLN